MNLEIQSESIRYSYPGNPAFQLRLDSFRQALHSPLGIYGLSGSGKSTLGQLVAGLLKPDEGSAKVLWANNKVVRVMYCHQFPERIFLGVRVAQTVELILQNSVKSSIFGSEFERFLKIFKLDYQSIQDRSGHELSGGELRRFALALIMAQRPELLILDEPTIGMGSEGQMQFHAALQECLTTSAVLLISHDLNLITKTVQTLWVINEGRLVYRGMLADFQTAPQELLKKVGVERYRALEQQIAQIRKQALANEITDKEKN
jgi:ABC-type multidrug transport system ATPase subunit